MQISITAALITRYTKFILGLAMVAGALLLVWFLNKNLYEPLTQAIAISELQTEVVAITVESKALQRVLATQSGRLAPLLDTSKIISPFQTLALTATVPTNSPPELR